MLPHSVRFDKTNRFSRRCPGPTGLFEKPINVAEFIDTINLIKKAFYVPSRRINLSNMLLDIPDNLMP